MKICPNCDCDHWQSIRLCSACYKWQRTHGTPRPLSVRARRLPTCDPDICDNPATQRRGNLHLCEQCAAAYDAQVAETRRTINRWIVY